MKRNIIYLCMIILGLNFFSACNQNKKKVETKNQQKEIIQKQNPNEIRVGVFNRNGDSPFCIIDAMEALRIDKDISPRVVTSADIVSGKADDCHVFLFPGGGGMSETNNLGDKGIAKIQELITKKGKGIIGICAGAYILTNTPNYAGFRLSGYAATDIEHDHRGNGLVKFSLTKEGEKLFPELKDRKISYCQYYEGPVLIDAKDTIKQKSLATMVSDVHLIKGTPANMTNNKPFITISEVGNGRTCSFVGHPECTSGMRWLIPRMARWAAKKEIISYNNLVVRPQIYTSEILFDTKLKKEQSKLYRQLFKTKEEKISAIKRIVEIRPWSAKKWFMGLLRDNEKEVRRDAAKALVELERTDAIADFQAAILFEKDLKTKQILQENLSKLKKMIGNNQKYKYRQVEL